MARVLVPPHRSLRAGVVTGSWTATVNGVDHPDVEGLPGLDEHSTVELHCEVDLDPGEVRRACGLSGDDGLALVATWYATATNLRSLGARVRVEDPGSHRLAFTIDPTVVGGSLVLTRLVVLDGTGHSSESTAARRPAAILWRESRRETTAILLERSERALPTVAAGFAGLPGADPGAAWWLELDLTDLTVPTARACELLVNTDHEVVMDLLGGRLDQRAGIVQSVIRWDVARALVTRAIDEPDFVAQFGSFAPESIGGALQRMFTRWLPETPPTTLRALRHDDPGQFEAALQAALRLLSAP